MKKTEKLKGKDQIKIRKWLLEKVDCIKIYSKIG